MPPPVSREAPDGPQPPVPLARLPAALQPKARWVDERFGNGDGRLGKRELNAYEKAFGADAGHRATIEALRAQLEPGGRPPPVPLRTVTVPATLDAAAVAVARRLVRPGGSGTAEDEGAVVAELAKLPAALLERVERARIKVVACRGSVTDYRVDLRGVQPRGWPPGTTWDDVPGMHLADRGEVVVATTDGPNGSRGVPDHGNGHGSFGIVAHELGHALDAKGVLGTDSKSPAFRAAWEADRPALVRNGETYLLQPGDAGPEEAFAEVGARYFGADAGLRRSYPSLHGFFRDTARVLGIPT